jgi:hypothetical protein
MQEFLTANLEIASNGKFMGALFPHGQSNKQTNKQTNQPTNQPNIIIIIPCLL